MALGMKVGIGPGHIVLRRTSSLPKGIAALPQFSTHVYCGKTVAHLSYC